MWDDEDSKADGVSVAIPRPAKRPSAPAVPAAAVVEPTGPQPPVAVYGRELRSVKTDIRPFPLHFCAGVALTNLNKHGKPMSALFEANKLVYDHADMSLAILGIISPNSCC